MTIYKGDAYLIPFSIKFGEDVITPSNSKEVEITIGKITKTSADGKITYANNKWYFPLYQAESFSLSPALQPVQVRVQLNNDNVRGVNCDEIEVVKNLSNRVLGATDDE